METKLSEKIDELTKKVDQILLILQKTKVKPQESDFKPEYKVTDYKESILISFPFHMEFKNYIKELGGVWMVGKKAWMFPKSNETHVLEELRTKFPTWKLI